MKKFLYILKRRVKTDHATQGEKIVHHHVEVLVFVKIIDLKQILFLQPIGGAGLQVHFDVFSLEYNLC